MGETFTVLGETILVLGETLCAKLVMGETRYNRQRYPTLQEKQENWVEASELKFNEVRDESQKTNMIIITNSHDNQYSQFLTHQYIFQLEISVSDTVSVNVFQSTGDVFCPSDHISRSCSS